MASLYVGDLHPAVNEYILLEKFSSIGQVYSIHVCRNKTTGESLRYAFVTFHQEADAERALELLNFDILLGQPMRIMWYPGGSSLRKSNVASIFIKNLEESINSMDLYNIFSTFGKVLSCEVVCDENGSRGYGYVHFESPDAAEAAIKRLNGMLFNNLKVTITHFKLHQEDNEAQNPGMNIRQTVPPSGNEGSIIIQNLEESINTMDLYDVFSTFGKVLSCEVVCDENGSRGHGYVHFESPDAAEAAIKRLNGMLFNDLKVTITHFKPHQEDNEAQNPGMNIQQTVPPSGNVVDAIPQAQNPTSIQQVKPHPSTHKTAQDVQLQGFQNMPEVTDPSVMRQMAIKGEKNKTAVRDAVPAAVKPEPAAVKPGPAAVPTAG